MSRMMTMMTMIFRYEEFATGAASPLAAMSLDHSHVAPDGAMNRGVPTALHSPPPHFTPPHATSPHDTACNCTA